MAKQITLDEITISPNTSREKTRFLELCKRRVVEAGGIIAEVNPDFNDELAQGNNPFTLIIEASKNYDAEISAGAWCYINSIAIKEQNEHRVNGIFDRNGFLLKYRGQRFYIPYGKIPKINN